MTITEIKRVAQSGSWADGKRTYTVKYQVRFTGAFSLATLMYAGGTGVGGVTLPQPGAGYPGDATSFATGIAVDLVSGSLATGTAAQPGVASYDVTYSPNVNEVVASQVHPTSRPAVIAWRGTDRTEVRRKDQASAPLVNSAGDYYDPLPECPVPGGECSITFNTAMNPATWCTTLSNTVNAAAFYGVEAGKVLIGIIEGTQQREIYLGNEVTYWQVSVPMRFNRDGWRWLPIDNGFKFKNTDNKKQHATDDYGARTPVPILLNGTGGELAVGGAPVVFPAAGYKIIAEVSWTALALPNPFL